MTYGEAKHKILGHCMADTIAGEPVELTYNNQADYVKRIPGLLNDVLRQLATSVKRLTAEVKLTDLESEELGTIVKYNIPSDCYRFNSDCLIDLNSIFDSNKHDFFAGYKRVGNSILLPQGLDEQLLFQYWRYPQKLSDNPSDNTVLDSSEEACEAAVFYVAGELMRYDNPYMYASLYNEFITQRNNMTEPIWYEYQPIEDVYNF